MADEHECRCATLPEGWGRCGKLTQSTWSMGCDGTMQNRAREHLGFRTRLEFIEWAQTQPAGSFGALSGGQWAGGVGQQW